MSDNRGSLPWTTAAKIGAREIAAARTKFLFIAFAIAVGVGSLAGVRGFARAFRTTLLGQARTLMAADLSLRVFQPPDEAQQAVLDNLNQTGARRTDIVETVSMLSAGGARPPLLVSLKAVEPDAYPFYGELKLDPAIPVAKAITPDTIAVGEDLFIRLGVSVGDTVRLGEASFRIAARVVMEPDRMTGTLNVGPRILMSSEGLQRTGLMQPGSRASRRFLFRLDPTRISIEDARAELESVYGRRGSLIADFREVHPLITRGLNRSERFLSLVSLIALVVGALGVAATMHSHLQQRLDSIAIMKCMGARTSHIVRIYLAETLAVGFAGGLLGCLVGIGVQAAFPLLIANFFNIAPPVTFDPQAGFEAMTVGVLTAVLFTWPALLGIQRIRPAVILRRDHDEAGGVWRRRWFQSPQPWLVGGGIMAGLAAIAGYLAGGSTENAIRTGTFFTGGLLVGLAALSAVSWLLLRLLRAVARNPRWKLPSTLRHGIANIYRPGNQAQAVLVSLGVGIMFTLSVFLLQRGLLQQLMSSAPPDMPNVFLINITDRERAGMEELLNSWQTIQGEPELVGAVQAQLTTVNGEPIAAVPNGERFTRPRSITWANTLGSQSELLQGQLWTGKGQVCIEDDVARDLRIGPGDRLAWTSNGLPVEAEVACVYRTEEVRIGRNSDFVFSPGSLENLPMQYFAAVRMKPADVAEFQRASFSRFPAVTVINGAEVLDIVQGVVDQIALVVRFISLFSILAGIIILASSVAATRFRRVREVAVLKTLGASRRRVMTIFSVEFLVLGLTAGILGSGLASGFSNLLLTQLLEAGSRFDIVPNLTAIALAAGITLAAGWLSAFRILSQKPLEVLRGE